MAGLFFVSPRDNSHPFGSTDYAQAIWTHAVRPVGVSNQIFVCESIPSLRLPSPTCFCSWFDERANASEGQRREAALGRRPRAHRARAILSIAVITMASTRRLECNRGNLKTLAHGLNCRGDFG